MGRQLAGGAICDLPAKPRARGHRIVTELVERARHDRQVAVEPGAGDRQLHFPVADYAGRRVLSAGRLASNARESRSLAAA